MPKGKSNESGETKMKTLSKALERKVFEIAKKEVYGLDKRGNLKPHYCDDEDFIEISVWCLENALVEAYRAGVKDAKKEMQKD